MLSIKDAMLRAQLDLNQIQLGKGTWNYRYTKPFGTVTISLPDVSVEERSKTEWIDVLEPVDAIRSLVSGRIVEFVISRYQRWLALGAGLGLNQFFPDGHIDKALTVQLVRLALQNGPNERWLPDLWAFWKQEHQRRRAPY